jgi:hypothetical protein
MTGGKPIAVLLQPISGVSSINPLVAFYDIHGGKREVLFFYLSWCPGHHTRRNILAYRYFFKDGLGDFSSSTYQVIVQSCVAY